MWKTNELRLSKPTVADEIENGLTYFRSTFLDAIPRLYAEIEDGIGSGDAPGAVPARRELDRRRSRRQPARHRRGDRARGRTAGVRRVSRTTWRRSTRWAPSCRCRRATRRRRPSCRRWPARSPDRGTSRDEEPYRRALVGIFARVAATRAGAGRRRGHARRRGGARARRTAIRRSCAADLRRHRDRAWSTTAPALAADGRLRNLIRDVEVFGFHLCPLDLRQHSGVHERVVSELLARATGKRGYEALAEPERQALLLRELVDDAAARLAARQLRRGDHAGAGDAGRDGARARPLRRARDPELRHLDDRGAQRRAGGGAAAQGGRPAGPGRGAVVRAQHHPAVRDHRGPAALRRRARPAVLDHLLPQAAREPRRHAGGDARLLGQQQGRRLPDVELGAVQGRAVDRADLPAARRRPAPVPRPRRHRRARRRPQLPRRARAAARQRQRAAAPDRAGRGDREQVRRSDRRRAATSGRWSRRRWRRRCCRAWIWATTRRRSRRRWRSCPRTRSRRTAASSTRRRASSTTSARRRRSTRSATSTSAAGPPAAAARTASRTCARSRGCSAGASRARRSPASTASARR